MPNPVNTVLANMSGKTVTLGWDVVVANSALAVNDLFAQQYVANVRANQHLPPIDGSLDLSNGVTVGMKNLTLGPPLISITPSVSDQQAVVTMNFIAGEIVVVQRAGPVITVSSYQSIVPGDQFALSMIVPLEKVQGEVEAHNKVVVNLRNANTYQANLLPGQSSASLLGQYFQAIFQAETKASLVYELGTLVTGADQNLTPVDFDIRTQVDPGGAPGQGSVTLFVATTYNPSGGNLPGSDYIYLIPDGSDCALVVASKTLFENIIEPFYSSILKGDPTFAVRQLSGSSPASYLAFTGGAVSAGAAKGNWISGGGVFHSFWSGTPGAWSFGNPGVQPVMVPFGGLTVAPSNGLLTINWSETFSQNFASSVTTTRTGSSVSQDSVNLTVSGGIAVSPTITNNNVSFPSGASNLTVQFAPSDWLSRYLGNGQVRDNISGNIAGAANNAAQQVVQIQLPQVNTFAVSHLLFPQQNALQYQEAHLPGDLALFGSIQPRQTAFNVTPLQAVIAGGETQQFTASGQNAPSWSVNPRIGTISSSGLYTAPKSVNAAVPVAIAATEGENVATAVVTIVPLPVMVSPAFTLVSVGGASVQLSASVLGGLGKPTWTLSPGDGSAGAIGSSGLFTPPMKFPPGVTVATATASAGGQSASTLLCLLDAILAVSIDPPLSVLGPNGTVQLNATDSNVEWSLLTPSQGSITQKGLYTAPTTIAAPTTALVQAQLQSDFVGIAVIALSPSGT
jgi:hypothetical protein